MGGISTPTTYKARYQDDKHHGSTGWHCVNVLKWRETEAEAQADLDAFAANKGWQVWCQTKI
jgi:hypothetical protein